MRVGSFGDKLRRERELRAVTLDEIAEATKIGTRSLKALEDEQFDILPGGIFNKGFVRAYAKYLGIDEEQAVADYSAAIAKASGGTTPAQSDEAVVASIAKKRSEPERPIGVDDTGSSKVWVTLAVVALIAAGGYSSWKYYQQRKADKAAAQAAVIQVQTPPPATTVVSTEPQPATAEPVPTSTDASSQQANSVAPPTSVPAGAATSTQAGSVTTPKAETKPLTVPAAGEFVVTLHAVEDVWIQVDADGSSRQETLKAASDKTIKAKDKVIMKIGKPGALEVSFNGTPVGPLGPPDKVVTRTFTNEGMQQ